MDEYILYLALALLVTLLLGILTFVRSRSRSSDIKQELPNEPAEVRVRPRPLIADAIGGAGGAVGGLRNRAIANRNARARMRVAQAQRAEVQRQQTHSDSENEPDGEEEEEIIVPDEKMGKKKLAKLQMKAEKKAMREADEREREEKKEREEQKAELRRQQDREREEEEARREEEERKKKEEEEKREQEEYERLKAQFEVEEEGFEEGQDEEEQRNMLAEFIDHIKCNKVVVLEDLAALFKLKTQAVIDRITKLQEDRILTGVIDDRGKFIYISQDELESVAKFIRQRGRISLSDLAEASNTLVNLSPETPVKA